MAPLSGLFGSVVITSAGTVPGTAAVVGMGEWNLDIGHAVVDTTAFGDAWERIIASIRSYSGSFSGNADTDTSHTTLRNAMLGGSAVALRLYDAAATYWLAGTVYLEEQGNGISYDGKGERNWGFKGDGPLSYV